MGKINSKQHVQMPHKMTRSGTLTPKDLLVYVVIKSFLNSESKECFPSINKIVEVSGISKPTVRKSIETLKKENYINVRLDGRKNVYSFNPYKTFEVFSPEFINNKNISATLKSYIIASQELMFKDMEGFGKVSYSNKELSGLINMDERTITKYDKELKDQGYLTMLTLDKKDPISGLPETEKIFHLNELGQEIIWALQKHDDQINNLENNQVKNTKDNEIILNRINKLSDELKIVNDVLKEKGIDIEEEKKKRIIKV